MGATRALRRGVVRLVVVAAFVLPTMVGVHAGSASSATRDRVALILGDSLTTETRPVFVAPKGWRLEFFAYPGIAPCDWFDGKRSFYALIAKRPAAVLIETAANDFTRCMRVDGKLPPVGSAGFYHRYEQSLLTVIRVAHRHGAKVIYIDPPPFWSTTLQRASLTLDKWARSRVTTTTLPRWAVSLDGKPTLYMRCLPNETKADGCVLDQIPVRTIDESDHTHFCPLRADFTKIFTCATYSSGEHRWAKAVMRVLRRYG